MPRFIKRAGGLFPDGNGVPVRVSVKEIERLFSISNRIKRSNFIEVILFDKFIDFFIIELMAFFQPLFDIVVFSFLDFFSASRTFLLV